MQELLTTLQRSAQQAATAGGLPLLFWLFQTVQWLSPGVETPMVSGGKFSIFNKEILAPVGRDKPVITV